MIIAKLGGTDRDLLRHDRMIVANELRSAFSSWGDRAIGLVFLLLVLVGLHSSLSRQPILFAAAAITILTTIIGAGTTRLVERRLTFHAYDGVLAAAALAGRSRRHYGLTVHLIGLGTVTVATSAVRLDLLMLAPIGYSAGAGTAHLAAWLAARSPALHRPAVVRPAKGFLQRPRAGVAVTMLVLLPFPFLRSLEPVPLAALIGCLGAIGLRALTMLDEATIRFMTLSGYGAWAVVAKRAQGALIFLSIMVPTCAVFATPLVAGIVGAIGLAMMTLMTARIFAYRVHPKRTANLVVSMCAGGIGVVAFSVPLLLPAAAVAVLWHLHRRAAASTWMIA